MRKTLQPAVRKPPVHGSVGSQMAGLYDLEETLGKGHFAVVKAAKHVFTGERVAVKVIDKTKLDAVSQKGLLKEVLCMKLVQHPHVVRLYEVIDTTTKMYLVLELGQGDLYDLILKHQGGLPEDLARKYFTQILAAVSYCHKLHVAHRDLKPENVVYFPTDGGQVKLTDFGFSNRFCPGVKLDTSCGSLAYSAPEILLGDAYDAPAVDVWSLGVILYMLACGRAPFQEANDSETLTMIMDVKYSIPPHVSPLCHDLIRRMLVFYPENRANLEDIEKDPWITQDGYLLSQVQLPLISHNRLTNEEKNSIIQQMVAGDITSREQILDALQTNAFNHVTSTFYLLAEKHLRERGNIDGDDNKAGTSSALTASLESLHDRRKNSDTEDLASGEDDSLAPLDLEIKNSPSSSQSSKKTSRMHTVLSSSALSELESLPILEEDASVHCEEVEDTHGPLPQAVGNPVIRRAHYNNRRVMVPQSSCSSSEDEDSEKKKRNLPPHRNKNKSAKGHSSNTGEELGRRFRDDESSDEQSGGCAGGFSGGTAPLSFTSVGQNSSKNGSGGGTDTPTSGAQGGESQNDSIEKKPCNNSYNHHEKHHHSHEHRHHHHHHSVTSRKHPEEEKKNGITNSLSFFDQEPDLTPQLSNLTVRKLPPISPGCLGNVEMIDRHSCGDVAYAVKNVVAGTVSDPGRSVAKKSKKLFFSWLFLRRKKSNINHTIPASSGIYKTRSCAELKLKNGLNRKQMDVNQNV